MTSFQVAMPWLPFNLDCTLNKKIRIKNSTLNKNIAIKNSTLNKNIAIKNSTLNKNGAIKKSTLNKNIAIKNSALSKNIAIKNSTLIKNIAIKNGPCDLDDDHHCQIAKKVGWLVVLGFHATKTAKVISWRSVTYMCFLAFSHQY